MNVIYPILHLPDVVDIGYQTENGVREIGFNVKPWLDAWDGLELAVYPTRPGETAAYPAADVQLVGSVLYWRPNDADTAIPGDGTVEVVGITADKRKLSGACKTVCKATTLATTTEPPEGIKPYYDGIIEAAAEVKQAAEDVQGVIDAGESGVYLVRATPDPDFRNFPRSDRTQEEIRAAVAAGKTVLMVYTVLENGYSAAIDARVMTYVGEVEDSNGNLCPTFDGYIENNNDGIPYYYQTFVQSSGIVGRRGSVLRAATKRPLKLTGAVEATFDGREEVTVDIPADVLIVTVTNTDGVYTADHTYAEIEAAVKGKAVVLLCDGKVYTYSALEADGHAFYSFRMSGSQDSLAEILYYRVAIDYGGNVAVSGRMEAATPNPWGLFFHGAVEAHYDGRDQVHITIPEGGGGGVSDPGTAHQMLVSDADGKAVWTDLLAYKTTGTVECLSETELMGDDDDGDGVNDAFYLFTPWNVDPFVGGKHVVTYNGAAYECEGVAVPDMPDGCVTLGNLSLLGLEGGNADAPFAMVCCPNALGPEFGTYGMLANIDGATSVTLSITGEATTIKRIDPEFLPPQITLTIGDDGTVTSDTDFATAWAMTAAQLQAAITVKDTGFYYALGATRRQGALVATKYENTVSGQLVQHIQVQWQEIIGDTSDMQMDTSTKWLLWDAGGISAGGTLIPGLPLKIGLQSGMYLRYNGERWIGVDIDQLKADLGLS